MTNKNPQSIKEIMQQMGFKKDAKASTTIAFISNLQKEIKQQPKRKPEQLKLGL